jgi:hypothetical protein
MNISGTLSAKLWQPSCTIMGIDLETITRDLMAQNGPSPDGDV